MPKLVVNTPAEKWLKTGELFKTKFLLVHVSDFLRLLALHQFGGVYFDLDFLVFKNLDDLQLSFFCEEEPKLLGNSVMSFDYKGIGHAMATVFLK